MPARTHPPLRVLRLLAATMLCVASLTTVQPAAAQSFSPLQPITMSPDLAVSMSATPAQVGGGKDLTYTTTADWVG